MGSLGLGCMHTQRLVSGSFAIVGSKCVSWAGPLADRIQVWSVTGGSSTDRLLHSASQVTLP